jgi:hypothetical protein
MNRRDFVQAGLALSGAARLFRQAVKGDDYRAMASVSFAYFRVSTSSCLRPAVIL